MILERQNDFHPHLFSSPARGGGKRKGTFGVRKKFVGEIEGG
jgi:hypothetical protein